MPDETPSCTFCSEWPHRRTETALHCYCKSRTSSLVPCTIHTSVCAARIWQTICSGIRWAFRFRSLSNRQYCTYSRTVPCDASFRPHSPAASMRSIYGIRSNSVAYHLDLCATSSPDSSSARKWRVSDFSFPNQLPDVRSAGPTLAKLLIVPYQIEKKIRKFSFHSFRFGYWHSIQKIITSTNFARRKVPIVQNSRWHRQCVVPMACRTVI